MHNYKNRYLIYTLGPTGSGKTNLQKYALEEVKKMEKKNDSEIAEKDIYQILIDNIVQKDNQYIEKVKHFFIDKCIIKYCNNKYEFCKHITDDRIINIIKNNIKKLESDIYFHTRKKEGCNNYEEEIKNFIESSVNFTMKCDIVIDYEIVKNILNETPIFIYESTGRNIDTQILDYNKKEFLNSYESNLIKKIITKKNKNSNNSNNSNTKSLSSAGENLKIILAFSIVHYKTLYERNNKRGLNDLKQFVKDLNNNSQNIVAPRFPNVYNSYDSNLCKTYKSYLKILKNILKNLENYEIKKENTNQKVDKIIFHFNENLKDNEKHKENEDYFIIDYNNYNQEIINKLTIKLNDFLKKYKHIEKKKFYDNNNNRICYDLNKL